MSFSSLGLSPSILSVIDKMAYKTPTPIQNESIPPILRGIDLLATAETGTGKTAAYSLPMVDRLSKEKSVKSNQVRALVLVPTRELAVQIESSIKYLCDVFKLRAYAVFGGVKINPQMMALRSGADVLIATPGRLLDLYRQNAIHFRHLEILVLDEADRMLDMGFRDELQKIITLLPGQRQNLMFSATFPDELRTFARRIVSDPMEVSVNPQNTTAVTIQQWLYPVDEKRKSALLTHLIKHNNWQQILVFSKTKQGANKIVHYLEKKNIKAAAIHGDKSQGARTKALSDFKSGTTSVLVATDLAARGLDINQLPQVVNYDLPHITEDYIHRIGRTGRAGQSGEAISLVCANEFTKLSEIERLIKKLIIRKHIKAFDPLIALPESVLDTRPIKPKKPKKQKKPKQPK